MIKELLKKMGYTPLSDKLVMPVELWRSWYEGKVSSFHEYRQYNGKRALQRTRKSLCMAKKVCEDWANMIFNEKVDIITEMKSAQSILDRVFFENNFRVLANRLVEQSFALGTAAFVEHKTTNGVIIDFITADKIFPLSFANGRITECAFASRMHLYGELHTYLNIHALEHGNYVIRNLLINERTQKCAPLPGGVTEEFYTNSPIPLFQIIGPNIANNLCPDSPLGISVFANAIDVLEGIDLVYDSYQNEFRLGKKRIVVPLSMAKIEMEQQGEILPVFDDNDTEFYAFSGADPDNFSITEINMSLRAEAHETGLQRNIDLLSELCGLGSGKYNYTSGTLKTATQIVSEQSELFRNLKKHELVMERAVRNLAKSVLYLSGEDPECEIAVNFDDSIIEDSETVSSRALLEKQNNIIDAAEYLARVYKMPRALAEQKLAEMTLASPPCSENEKRES